MVRWITSSVRLFDAQKQRVLREQMDLEERVGALKRLRCPTRPCVVDCAFDHEVPDEEAVVPNDVVQKMIKH